MKFTYFFQCIYVNIVLYAKKKITINKFLHIYGFFHRVNTLPIGYIFYFKHSIFILKIVINEKKTKFLIGCVFLNYST